MFFKKSLSPELKGALDRYIRQTYEAPEITQMREFAAAEDSMPAAQGYAAPMPTAAPRQKESAKAAGKRHTTILPGVPRDTEVSSVVTIGLDDQLEMLDESFQQMLMRKIDEKGMRDSVCYKRAGVDRKLFSKIRSNPYYKPKKTTAIAFCIALSLPYDEAEEMLRKAGYALSRSSKFDVIVEYFIKNRRYDLNELNMALYEYDQPLIG